jgi:hypothetical protein
MWIFRPQNNNNNNNIKLLFSVNSTNFAKFGEIFVKKIIPLKWKYLQVGR